MSVQIRDLRCGDCGFVLCDAATEFDDYPACRDCGGNMFVTWEFGKAPHTDVYGVAQYSDATGMWHTSQRDKIRVMKEWGYEEAGDPVGGARKDHRLKNTTISAPGLGLRTSSGERERARKRG